MSLNWGNNRDAKRVKYMHNSKEKQINIESIKSKNKEDDDDDSLGSLFNLEKLNSEGLISREGNHIYFWDEVNTENALKFTKMLRKVDYNQQCAVLKGEIDEAKIYIHFNSPGGSLTDGFSMASSVKNCRSKTIGIVEGCVASATTLPLVVCNYRQMQRYSYFLIHQLSTNFWGTFNNLLDETETCKDMMNVLSGIYLDHTKIPRKKLERILKSEIMLNSDMCLKYNIVDELV